MRFGHKDEMKKRRRNIKLSVAYDGTNYCGFQYQNPPAIAVQNVLESTLEQIFGDSIEMAAAGRTDAGVHAYEQVVNFFTDGQIPLDRIPIAANALLPTDITVLKAEEADRDFSARHSAKRKTYVYKILNAPLPDPFLRNGAWHIRKQLDLLAMSECMEMIEGTHDFSSFKASGGADMNPVRTMYEASLVANGDIVELSFSANGFMYHMVRNIVGTLVNVGMGRTSVMDFASIMASLDRKKAGATAPARGLYLLKVEY